MRFNFIELNTEMQSIFNYNYWIINNNKCIYLLFIKLNVDSGNYTVLKLRFFNI